MPTAYRTFCTLSQGELLPGERPAYIVARAPVRLMSIEGTDDYAWGTDLLAHASDPGESSIKYDWIALYEVRPGRIKLRVSYFDVYTGRHDASYEAGVVIHAHVEPGCVYEVSHYVAEPHAYRSQWGASLEERTYDPLIERMKGLDCYEYERRR